MSPDLSDLLQACISDVVQALNTLDGPIRWALEEIEAAAVRYPDAVDAVDGSFLLLRPTHPLLGTEEVYRAHCVELLDRVVRSGDTRLGTAAECCVVLARVSLEVPLPSHAVGLYARMWQQAGLEPTELAAMGTHYEAIVGTQIDDLEAELRHKLRQDWRIRPTRDASS